MRKHAASSSPLRVLFTIGAAGALSDGELLSRFLDGRAEEAEAAFGLIVERHGGMVRHVCLSILGNPDDAADAFQASFIVLARRARTIRDRDSVGPWLFGVSRRVALKARAAAARRRVAERTKAEQDAPRLLVDDPAGSPSADDWSALYEELDRLPARYRDPLVLCHLEGLTLEQAASRLGCPLGTLRTRLGRGRDRLRARLLRRGYSPASVAPLLLSPAALPSAPMSLASIGWASSATRIAVASRGLSLASLSVPLASATLRSMSMIAFVRSLALGGVALSALGLGAGGFLASGNAGPGDEPSPVVPPPAVASLPQDEPIEPDEPVPQDGEAPDAVELRPFSVEVISEVPGETRILSVEFPHAGIVKEGDLILELDSTDLREQLEVQQITTEQAQSAYYNAVKSREIAEIEVLEYIKGIYPQEEFERQSAITLAQAELKLAKNRLTRLEKGASPEEIEAAEVEVLRAELNLENAKRALVTLEQYTYEARIKRLEGVVERAKADELAKDSLLGLEKQNEVNLRDMIERCKVRAPRDGRIAFFGVGLQENAVVKKNQKLFMIHDRTAMLPQVEFGGVGSQGLQEPDSAQGPSESPQPD